MSLSGPKDEYNSLCENMRWYSSIRFAQLTLFLAVLAGLSTALYASGSQLPFAIMVAFKLCGLLTTIIFWVLEERAAEYWRHFKRRAIELEEILGYSQFSSIPSHKINTSHILRIYFTTISLFWIIILLT